MLKGLKDEDDWMMEHAIPIGVLVEVRCDHHPQNGIRAFVAEYRRSNDGTPQYGLTMDIRVLDKISDLQSKTKGMKYSGDLIEIQQTITYLKSKIEGYWDEGSLIIVGEANCPTIEED